jgi:hypothetical protein
MINARLEAQRKPIYTFLTQWYCLYKETGIIPRIIERNLRKTHTRVNGA